MRTIGQVARRLYNALMKSSRQIAIEVNVVEGQWACCVLGELTDHHQQINRRSMV